MLDSTSASYGSCVAKEKLGTFSYTIYVRPVTNQMVAPVQSLDGSFLNPFNYIQDAITRAYELAALFNVADMTIILLSGTHAMLRKAENMYMPYRTDKWSQNVRITLQSENSAAPVTVLYKMRDTFKFLVGGGLTIKNVIFEAIDSSISPNNDPNNCLKDMT